MYTTVLKEISSFLFGRKYWVNIVGTRGTTKQESCSYIFTTREAAERHRQSLVNNRTFYFVETVSFRSRKLDYAGIINRNNNQYNYA